MGHAHLQYNRWVDDNGMDIDELPFADRAASKFAEQIKLLEAQRSDLPVGWHPIFNDAIRMLNAVDCPRRDGIEFSEPAMGRGGLRIQLYFATTDKVVRGIINKLTARSECTCELCGRSYGALYRHSSEQTLCARCHVETDLKQNVSLWLDDTYKGRIYRETPILEFDSLPWTLQQIVSKYKVKKLYLPSQGQPVRYVTPADVLSHAGKMKVIKQFLDPARNT